MAKNIFNSIQVKKPQTSTFDMSHDVKMSLDMGKLIPVATMEVLPGDVWNISSEVMLRFAPMVAPMMHKVNVTTHWFFVPNRILWSNWEKFITANNGKPDVPAPPMVTQPETPVECEKGSPADYMGVPTGVTFASGEVSALPAAAYFCIFDEYYRDQNLQASYRETFESTFGITGYLQDGDNNEVFSDFFKASCTMYRSWQHDYFTAALPFAQKGDSVDIPLGRVTLEDRPVLTTSPGGSVVSATPSDLTLEAGVTDLPNTEMYVAGGDGGDVDATTINDLRRAFRLQEWLEKMARGGSRYIEQILVHFGVKSSDARLQRPEFLGGSKQPVIVSEVLQTAQDSTGAEDTTPLGTMGGHGVSAGRGKNIRYRAEEHGYIMGIVSVTPLTAYQQGLHRSWTRQTHLDYAWPSFAHIGEQEVYNKEVYYHSTDGLNDDTFGYVPRYSEYRYMNSRVAGDFRDSLAFWHLGRIFDNRPLLNEGFIQCRPRKDIFAVNDEDVQNLWSHVFHSIRVSRRLPKYGTPAL